MTGTVYFFFFVSVATVSKRPSSTIPPPTGKDAT